MPQNRAAIVQMLYVFLCSLDARSTALMIFLCQQLGQSYCLLYASKEDILIAVIGSSCEKIGGATAKSLFCANPARWPLSRMQEGAEWLWGANYVWSLL